MLVCEAQPQTWQSGLNLRTPGLGAHSWRGEKRHPCRGPRCLQVVLPLLHLVLQAPSGPRGHHWACVEIHSVNAHTPFSSTSPRASLARPDSTPYPSHLCVLAPFVLLAPVRYSCLLL